MLDVMKRSKLPPIARWGIEPLPDEPAHGFFLRLAALNGQESIRPFAMALGINGRNIKPQEMMQLCEELPIPRLTEMRDITPVVDGSIVTIRGETLRHGRDWSLAHRRYCPACLQESSYHRYWFDLAILRTCPVHGIELQCERNGMVWAWGKGSTGLQRAGMPHCPPAQQPTAFSRYLINRISKEQLIDQPELDRLLLLDAVELITVLGNMIIHNWKKRLPKDNWLSSKQRAAEEGYNYISGGGSIEEICEEYVKSSGYYNGSVFTTRDMSINLGWLYYYAIERRSNGLNRVREILEGLLTTRNGKKNLDENDTRTDFEKLIEYLHKKTGIYKHDLKYLLSWKEDCCLYVGKGTSNNDIEEEIIRRRSLLIDRDETLKILRISDNELELLRRGKIVTPVIPAAGGRTAKYKRSDIIHLIELTRHGLKSQASEGLTIDQYRRNVGTSFKDVIAGLIDGRILPVGVDRNNGGLKAVFIAPDSLPPRSRERDFRLRRKRCDGSSINICQAAALLKTSNGAVRTLLEMGALKRAHSASAGQIDRKSLADFRSEYALPNLYAVALGCQAQWAERALRPLGITPPNDMKARGLKFVNRRGVETVLGLGVGELPSVGNTGAFFNVLEDYLVELPQAHRLLWTPNRPIAALVDSQRIFKMFVRPEAERLVIALPTGSDTIGQRNRAQIALLSQSWPTAIEMDLDPIGPCLVEYHSLASDAQTEAMAWVAARAVSIHAALARKRSARKRSG